MQATSVISGRVPTETAVKLDHLAERLDRSRGWIVARAVEQYVESEFELMESLDEAERQIDRGEFYAQEEMEAWVASLRSADTAA